MTKQDILKILPIAGAIAGDIIGSSYELKGNRTKDYNFTLFNNNSTYTDDTVLTIAVANWLLDTSIPLQLIVRSICRKYMEVGYGHSFKKWLFSSEPEPYQSWGNGSAMRVSPIVLKTPSLKDALQVAEETAIITHNHSEGIKGAKAVTAAIFLARHGFTKVNIKDYIENKFGYNLSRDINTIRTNYSFDSSCQGSVLEAIIAFLQSSDFEDAIRLAVSLGGDADTQACIAGSIAASFYDEIPDNILDFVFNKLPEDFIDILHKFIDSLIYGSQSAVILTAKEDLFLNSYIRYTFALAVTDSTKVFIPKGTRVYVEIKDRKCSMTQVLSNREQIFSRIENELKNKFPDFTSEYPYLCNGILLDIDFDMYNSFYISEVSDDDIFNLFNI